jgi:hypothetical protein
MQRLKPGRILSATRLDLAQVLWVHASDKRSGNIVGLRVVLMQAFSTSNLWHEVIAVFTESHFIHLSLLLLRFNLRSFCCIVNQFPLV